MSDILSLLRNKGVNPALVGNQIRLAGVVTDKDVAMVKNHKREIILKLLMESPLRPQRKWTRAEARELSEWLDTRPIDDRVWVSNRALLYDERGGITWKSDCFAMLDLREVTP